MEDKKTCTAQPPPNLSAARETSKNTSDLSDLSAEQFLDGITIKRYLGSFHSKSERLAAKTRLQKRAKELNIPCAGTLLKEYLRDVEAAEAAPREPESEDDQISDFPSQPLALFLGKWRVDSQGGIWKPSEKKGREGDRVYACSHPIMPARILQDFESGLTSVALWFLPPSRKRSVLLPPMPRAVLADKNAIVAKLSNYNVSVITGERAQAMAEYFCDMIDLNPTRIPRAQSVKHMGWVDGADETYDKFVPFAGDIVLEENEDLRPLSRAICKRGSFDTWLAEAKEIRAYSPCAKVVLAASFAAPLLKIIGIDSFMTHLWGTESGTGKSVALMLGGSVWGDPKIGGDFVITFDATKTSIEIAEAQRGSIPLCIDEFQIARDSKSKDSKFSPYRLTSGSGRARATKNLGLRKNSGFRLTILTTGETPIVDPNAGAGEYNRVIEIECKEGDHIIRDGLHTANLLRGNFGFAGERFIHSLIAFLATPDGKDTLIKQFNRYYQALIDSGATEKQASAGAICLVADQYATEWVFQDGNAMSVAEMRTFLKSRAQVSTGERGYETILSWIASNSGHFYDKDRQEKREAEENNGTAFEDRPEIPAGVERYGAICTQDGVRYAAVLIQAFREACKKYTLNGDALSHYLRDSGRLLPGHDGKLGRVCYFGKSAPMPRARCYWIRLPDEIQDSGSSSAPDSKSGGGGVQDLEGSAPKRKSRFDSLNFGPLGG